MDRAEDFLLAALIAAKNFVAAMPDDILYLGIIMGFFCAAAGWRKNTAKLPGFLLRLTDTSGSVALVACVVAGAYILLQFSALNLAQYIAMLIAGLAVYKILHLILDLFGRLSAWADTLLIMAAGPVTVLVCWLFYSNRLVGQVNRLIGKIFQ